MAELVKGDKNSISPAFASKRPELVTGPVTIEAPDGARTTTVKLKGRVRKAVQVKLYAARTFAARLATYRPKDAVAAARFDALAVAL